MLLQVRSTFGIQSDWKIDALVLQGGWSDFFNLQFRHCPQWPGGRTSSAPGNTSHDLVAKFLAGIEAAADNAGADFVVYTGIGVPPDLSNTWWSPDVTENNQTWNHVFLTFMVECQNRAARAENMGPHTQKLLVCLLPYYSPHILPDAHNQPVKLASVPMLLRDIRHSIVIAQNLLVTNRYLTPNEQGRWHGFACPGAFHRESARGLHGPGIHPSQSHQHHGETCPYYTPIPVNWGFQSYRCPGARVFNYPHEPSVSWDQFMATR